MKKIAAFYKALSDEVRLKIIDLLSNKEMCVCEIIDELDMSQPAISHHLKILRHAGVVKDCRDGKWIYYSLNKDVFEKVFRGESEEIIRNYAEPFKRQLEKSQMSSTKTDSALCEKLTAEQDGLTTLNQRRKI